MQKAQIWTIPLPKNYLVREIFQWVLLWIFSYILLFPLSHTHLPYWSTLFIYPVEKGIFLLSQWLSYPLPFGTAIFSDNGAHYLFHLFLIPIAIGWRILLQWKMLKPFHHFIFSRAIPAILIYFLAWQWLVYGANKCFKWQFYLPEPNLLFSKFGELQKDILYWSTMGVSRPYNIFLGSIEILCGILLISTKFRKFGLWLSLLISVQVLAVNFSFDISVKLFSGFLFFISLILLVNQLDQQQIYLENTPWKLPNKWQKWTTKYKALALWIKPLVIGWIAFDVAYPYVADNNFNDDQYPRPVYHGAYLIQQQKTHKNPMHWKMIFIHRRGYFITEDQWGQHQDYQLLYSKEPSQISAAKNGEIKGTFHWQMLTDKTEQTLQGRWDNEEVLLHLKPVDWRKMPALNSEIHWRSDQ